MVEFVRDWYPMEFDYNFVDYNFLRLVLYDVMIFREKDVARAQS